MRGGTTTRPLAFSTQASVTYGPAHPADRPRLFKLLLRERLNFASPYTCDVEKCVVVARTQGSLVGGAKLGRMSKLPDTYQLSSVVVDEAWRGQGIGKSLIRRALELAPDGSTVFLTTLRDRRGLYEEFGFKIATPRDQVPASLRLEMAIGAVLFSVASSLIVMVRASTTDGADGADGADGVDAAAGADDG